MKDFVSKIVMLFVALICLSSCVTSKAVVKLVDSFDYGIKQVHSENKNSTYDKLVADYYESLKSSNQKFAEKLAKDTMLYLSKSKCLGNCPVFSITIYNNGKVKYEGVSHVKLKGIFESSLEPGQQEEARRLIDAIDLPKMYSKYPRGVNMVDDVAFTQMVISDGIVKFPTAISYGQPDELKNIELYLTQLVEDLSWVQI